MDKARNQTFRSIQVEICDARVTPPVLSTFIVKIDANELIFTVGDVLQQSGLARDKDDPRFTKKGSFGVFGIRQAWDSQVYEGDRVEIYAPLHIDPKNARRKKANQNKDANLKAKALKRAAEKVEKSKI